MPPRRGVPRREAEAEAGSGRLPCSRLPCSRLPCNRPWPCSRPAAEAEEEQGVSAGVSARTGARLRPVPNEAEAEEAEAAGGGWAQVVSRES